MDAEIEGQLILEGILSEGPPLSSPTAAAAAPLGDLLGMALRSASLASSMSLSLRWGGVAQVGSSFRFGRVSPLASVVDGGKP